MWGQRPSKILNLMLGQLTKSMQFDVYFVYQFNTCYRKSLLLIHELN